jgi:hypothetical protein
LLALSSKATIIHSSARTVTTTNKAKATKVITVLDLKALVLLSSTPGHGDSSSLVALEACHTVVLLPHQLAPIALLLRDHMALLITTSTRPATSTTVRRTARGATTITTMTTVKVHPVQALMAREDTDMVAMPVVAAVVAVTDLGDEEDAVLTTDLVAALPVTTVLHTKDILEALTATAVPPTTVGLDNADPGVVADHLQVLVLSEVPSADQTSSAMPHPSLHRYGRHSLPSTHPTRTTIRRRRTTKTSPLKPTSSIHLPHT